VPVSLDKDKVAELAKEIKQRVCLTYRPIGISLIEREDEIPKEARRPSERGQAWPVCLAENLVRTFGWTIALTVDDNFCVLASAGLGLTELPDYLKKEGIGSHHTKTKKIGMKFQENLEKNFFEPGSNAGIILTPATEPVFLPQGVIIYGNPSQIGKICKGIAWYRGEPVEASAGGVGGCIVAARAATKDRKPRVVLPCSGEKILGHTEEHEVFLACPVEELPDIVEGMKGTDFMFPYPSAKFMTFESRVPKTYPTDVKTYKAWKAGMDEHKR
jgi:uncharacterized protein (DUF169 family)